MRRLAVIVATGFGLGRLPIAPATWASFAILLLLPIAIWASGAAEQDLGHDAKPIVVDEIVGMLVAVWCVTPAGGAPSAALLGAAFLLFRLFDIAKPFP